jgi:hypothetical protein
MPRLVWQIVDVGLVLAAIALAFALGVYVYGLLRPASGAFPGGILTRLPARVLGGFVGTLAAYLLLAVTGAAYMLGGDCGSGARGEVRPRLTSCTRGLAGEPARTRDEVLLVALGVGVLNGAALEIARPRSRGVRPDA